MPKPVTRRWLLLACASAPWSKCLSASALQPRLDGDILHVSAPQFRFLTGKALERLKDGATVNFTSQLLLFIDSKGANPRRTFDRFTVSYDLWEEKFSVVKRGNPPRSVSRLSATSAENWCVESLSISVAGIGRERQIWLRLEFRAEDPKDEIPVVGEPGINLTRLVEIFSRPPRTQEASAAVEAGPFRLVDLRGGSRGG
jgi:hypothetical protein